MFTFARWQWNVDAAQMLVAAAPRMPEQVPVAELRGLLGLIRVNPDHVAEVDLTQPILLAPLPGDAAERVLPIDGWHRIAKAVAVGVETLPAVRLTAEESKAVRRHKPRTRPRGAGK